MLLLLKWLFNLIIVNSFFLYWKLTIYNVKCLAVFIIIERNMLLTVKILSLHADLFLRIDHGLESHYAVCRTEFENAVAVLIGQMIIKKEL